MALEDFAAEMDRCSSVFLLQVDSVRPGQELAVCQELPQHCVSQFQQLLCPRPIRGGPFPDVEDKASTADTVRDIVYTCMTCGSCDVSCKVCRYNLEPLEMVRELKFSLVEDGQRLDEHQAVIDESAQRRQYHAANQELGGENGRMIWMSRISLLRKPKCSFMPVAGSVMIVICSKYCPGRGTAFEECRELTLALWGNGRCVAAAEYTRWVIRDEFTHFARANMTAWDTAGVKTVVTSCADGYHAFKRLYPQLGSQVEVLHTVEFIDRLIKEGKLTFRSEIPMTVTYHDPCHLGRQGEPYVPWNGVEKEDQESNRCL